MGTVRQYFHFFRSKLFLPLCICIALSGSSCSKEEPVIEDMLIGFGANLSNSDSGNNSTKFNNDAETFEKTDIMGVYGYLVHNGTYGNDGDVAYSTPYISNEKIEYDANQTVDTKKDLWHFNPAKYWPNMGYKAIKFYSYWPSQKTTASTDGSTANSQDPGLTVVQRESNSPYFIYRTDVQGSAANEDFLVAQGSGWREVVDLKFRRPLSKVVFKVKYEDFIGAKGVDINFPIIPSGNFYYKENGDEDGSGWVLPDSPTLSDLKIKNTTVTIPGNSTETFTIGTCYLIPQVVEKFSIIWNYHKEAKDYSNSADSNGFLNLEAGKSYTITISITKDHVIRVVTAVEETDEVQKWNTITNQNTI